MNNQTLKSTSAELWTGNHDNLVWSLESELQHFFCKQNGCKACITCRQIQRHEHQSIMWFSPETSSYTVEQLDPLFETIRRLLDPNEHMFFIIQHADALNPTCSNKLLKPMEEPPTGYHFILLTENKDILLPTIKSRCIERTIFQNNQQQEKSPLLLVFTQGVTNPIDFLKILDESNIDEYATKQTIIQLYEYCSTQYTKDASQENLSRLKMLEKAIKKLPMPGSSKLFWKNLFLLWNTNRK
jgi:DNA polymerase-3 subunit delta'